jgi:hypothetical protein
MRRFNDKNPYARWSLLFILGSGPVASLTGMFRLPSKTRPT